MRKVRIDRTKWLRGGGITLLWEKSSNAGCCLGHVAKQISRKTEEELNNLGCPESVYKKPSILTILDKRGDLCDNNFSKEAMVINDSLQLSEDEREKQLIALFKKNKIKLTFFN